jgi:PAS domain S-box-containing protein
MFHVPLLYGEWHPRETPTHPVTAVALLLASLALWLFHVPDASPPPRWRRSAAVTASALLLALSGLSVLHRLWGWNGDVETAINGLFASHTMIANPASSLPSAACLLLVALLLLYTATPRPQLWLLQTLALPVVIGSIWSILERVVEVNPFSNMAINAGLGCLLLVVGARSLRPSRFIVESLESTTLPGRLICLLPMALIVPILIGALPDYAEHAGWLSAEDADQLQLLLFVASIIAGYLLTIRYVGSAEKRLQIERQLQEQQKRYKLIVEASHDGIWLFGTDNRVAFANHRIEELLGYGPGELVGRHIDELVAAEFLGLVPEVEQILRAGQFADFESRLRRRDGSEIWVRSSITPLADEKGEPSGALALAADISASKAAEQARGQTLSLLKATLDATVDGIVVIDSDGRIAHYNQRFQELWGVPRELLDSGDRAALLAALVEQVEDPEAFMAGVAELDDNLHAQLADTIRLKDGRYFERSSTPQLLDREIVGRVISVRDVTARMQAAKERERSLALLKATLESTAEGIIAISPDNRITTFNRHFTLMWGMPQDLLERGERQPVLDFEAAQLADPEQFLARSAEFSRRPTETFFETLHLKDGRVFERYTIPQLQDGRPAGRVVTIRDVTARAHALDALRESQSFLEEAQRVGGVGTWSLDIRTGRLFWSEQAFRLLGLDPALSEASVETLASVVHPDDKELVRHNASVSLAQKGVHEIEYRVVLPDGSIRLIHSRNRLVLDELGEPLRLHGLEQDITERRRAEDDLRRSQQALAQAQKVAHIGSWEWDLTHDKITWSDEMYAIFAASRGAGEESLAAVSAYVHPQDREILGQAVTEAIERGTGFFAEFRYERPAGNQRYLEVRGECLQQQAGRAGLLVGVVQDVTERVEARHELESSLALIKATLESTGEGVLAVDRAGRITAWNQRFAAMWDVPSALLESGEDRLVLNSAIDQLEDPAAFIERVKELYREPLAESFDVVRFKDGRVFERTSRPQLVNGESVGRVWGFIDITPRLQAEAERQKLEDQLRQAQKMEAIGTLAGGIAHDFNNILAAILGYATLVRDELPPDSQVRADQQEVLTAAERATDLVRHILAFSRQHQAEIVPVRLAAVIKEVARLLRASLPSTIALHWHVDDDVDDATVMGDVSQLHQILMNLGTNAGYAMKASGGKLEITLSGRLVEEDGFLSPLDPGRYLQLSVTDNGPGIPAEIRERIFDPFFTTKEVGEGTGLGLSTVHGIVAQMGGAVTVYSEVGIGTVFHVYLPRADRTAAAAGQAAPQLPRGEGRILFVDDEPAIAKMGQMMLQKLGYSVTPMEDSTQALELFRSDPQAFDLVITDQTMPGLTGDRLTLGIHELRPLCPVILCTGFSEILTPEKLAELRVADFLTKPVAPSTMASAVARTLGGQAEAMQAG